MVLVIAFLVLVTALGATGMRRLAVARQWSNMRSDRMQQEAMFEAGMERFIVKAKRDTAFQGDDWKIQFERERLDVRSRPRSLSVP